MQFRGVRIEMSIKRFHMQWMGMLLSLACSMTFVGVSFGDEIPSDLKLKIQNQAAQLLRNALACPKPKGGADYQIVNEYRGDGTKFAVHETRYNQFDDMGMQNANTMEKTISVNFKDIEIRTIIEDNTGQPTGRPEPEDNVFLACQGNKLCFTVDPPLPDQIDWWRYKYEIEACDVESAKQIKKAVAVLIKMAQ